jgi:tetratricopeptide (TPR) repeat protein
VKFAVALLSLTALSVAWIVRDDAPPSAAGPDAGMLALQGQVHELSEAVARLQQRVEQAGARGDSPPPAPMVVAAPAPEPPAPPVPAPGLAVADAIARLDEVGHWSEEGRALWKQLAAAGLLDEAVAFYRARAEAAPGDADAQADLGDALAQQSHETRSALEQAELARLADLAYDAALAANPQHWRARFHKAVSYTFWPAVMGKQGAAIDHFQQLIEQQSAQFPQPGYEKTYLYLGNLYAQLGQMDQAHEVWKKGLAVFPSDPALLAAMGM